MRTILSLALMNLLLVPGSVWGQDAKEKKVAATPKQEKSVAPLKDVIV